MQLSLCLYEIFFVSMFVEFLVISLLNTHLKWPFHVSLVISHRVNAVYSVLLLRPDAAVDSRSLIVAGLDALSRKIYD